MASWPRMDRLGGSFRLHLQRALVESFFPTHTTEGISVLFDRWGGSVRAAGSCSCSAGTIGC